MRYVQKRRKTVKHNRCLGAFLAPLAAPIVYMAFVLIFLPDDTPKHELTWEAVIVAAAFGFIPASYLVSFVFGAPLIYVLGRLEKLSFWWVTILAAPLGAISLVCILLVTVAFGVTVHWELVGWAEIASFLCTGAVLGVCIAVSYCLIVGTHSLRQH